ncbi:MAG: YIP1 family protein [Gemmatimonadaceae bacterium]
MTAPDDFGSTAVPPASAKPAGLWEDFIDIFVSPSEVFERRRNYGFFLPLIILTIIVVAITVVGSSAMQSVIQSDIARGMAAAAKKNPNLTADQISGSTALFAKFTPVIAGFATFVMPLIVGVILWVVGKFFSAKEDIGQACMIATYAAFPRVLDAILRLIQAFLLDPSKINGMASISLSPARFLNPDTASPVMLGLLSRFDLFTIWATVLLAIGLAVVARIPKSRAAMAGVLVWVIGSLPVVLGALRAS